MKIELIKRVVSNLAIEYYVTIDGVIQPGSSTDTLGEAMMTFEYLREKHSNKPSIKVLISEEI